MMTKKKQFGWMLIMALTTACSSTPKQAMQKEVSTIDLTEIEFSSTPQPLSDFVESIEYIKLSEEPLVTEDNRVGIQIDNDGYIYLEDMYHIFKYDSNGNFLKNLVRLGPGPNEILEKYSSFYNMDNKTITIYTGGAGYAQISLDGDILERNYSDESRRILACWKNYELFRYPNPLFYADQGEKYNKDSLYFFHVKDLNTGATVFKMKNHHFHIKAKINGSQVSHPAFPVYRGTLNENTFWVKPMFVDTIYHTTNWTDVSPLYVIQQSDDAADYKWHTIVEAGLNNVSRYELFHKRQLASVFAMECGILYSYIQEIPEKIGIGYCPANGKSYSFSKLFKNDVDNFCPSLDFEIPLYQGHLFQKDGYLYTLVDAFKFFEEGAKPPFPDLTEDSNPVIVKLKLKKNG